MELNIHIHENDKVIIRQAQLEAEKKSMDFDVFLLHLIRTGLTAFHAQTRYQTYHDLDSLAGTWSPEEASIFNKAIADFENIDEALWS